MTADPVTVAVWPKPARVVPLPGWFAEQTATFVHRLDARLDEVVAELSQIWHTDLAEHQPVDVLTDHDLPEMMRALATTGKRIRPIMCFWGWVTAGGAGSTAGPGHPAPVRTPYARTTPYAWTEHPGLALVLQVSVALELLHVFALIHDDVMDESDSRRGQPSVHTLAAQLHLHAHAMGNAQRFGESIAVLVGDLAHAEADQLVATLPAPLRQLWRLLVIELVHGQSRDLTGTAAGRRDMAHARQVARMKSGSYTVQRPLQLGAAAAGASADQTAAISLFGQEVGEAFALRDDLLGVWGDPRRTGKPAGDDLLSGKPTVIASLAHDRLRGPARDLLDQVGTPNLSPADVRALQDALREHGIVTAVEQRISGHVDAALAALDRSDLDPYGVAGLTQMAHQVAWRDR